MQVPTFSRRRRLLALSAAALAAFPARAAYPERAIRIIVPVPAGGAVDFIARAYAEHLSRTLKQSAVVENRPGASGRIGVQAVGRSPADGHTLLVTTTAFVQALLLPGEAMYQVRDFEPILELTTSPIAFAVPTTLGVASFKEFADLVRSGRGKFSYGSAGTGQTVHFYGELLRLRSGLDLQHIPYKGEAPFLADLAAGHVSSGFGTVASIRPYVEAGKLRPLAVPGAQRSPLLPAVPTLRELGFDGFDAVGWFGLLAPAGTPRTVVDMLNAAGNALLSQPDFARRLNDMGLQPVGGTPDAFARTLSSSTAQWAAIIKASGIKLE
jgi:tripartite-type tricarboxylate transporter receptor subunit TctC